MSLLPDLRVAVRGLVRDRAYTTLGLLSIAFGIAANTIIFSLVDGVLLRPLRYTDPGRLVAINEVVAELAKMYPKLPVSARHYLEWKERASAFAQIGIVEADRAIPDRFGRPRTGGGGAGVVGAASDARRPSATGPDVPRRRGPARPRQRRHPDRGALGAPLRGRSAA